HGLAAMDIISPRDDGPRISDPDIAPCSYILSTHESREQNIVTATGAKIESGDTQLTRQRRGKSSSKRAITFDDISELLNRHFVIRPDQIGAWIRTAKLVANSESGLSGGGEQFAKIQEVRERAIAETRDIIPDLQRLNDVVATHTSEEQVPLNPADWADACKKAQSKALDFMDGTTAEKVHADSEGRLVIPLRAMRPIFAGIERGTAWIAEGFLHVAVPTEASKEIKNGALVMDATPNHFTRKYIEALGGRIKDVHPKRDSLKVAQFVDGAHSKTACTNPKSREREKHNLLASIMERLEHGYTDKAGNHVDVNPLLFGVFSHMKFIEFVLDEIAPILRYDDNGRPIRPKMTTLGIPTENFGWFGRHNRGSNDWKTFTALLFWGVSRLGGRSAERIYGAGCKSVKEVGGVAHLPWSGERTKAWCRVPGTDVEIEADVYTNPDVQAWDQSWVTGEVEQGNGRLRAARRDEPLYSEIHATYAFSDAHGFAVDEVVEDAAWRTDQQYNQDRATDQGARAVIGLAAVQMNRAHEQGRRTVKKALNMLGFRGIDHDEWAEVSARASGLLSEYALFTSQTTPGALETAYNDVAEALPAVAGLDLSDLALLRDSDRASEHGFTPTDRVADLILGIARASDGQKVAGAPPATS
ncbi:hypothetical protein, partial [Acidithiobacillus sp.]|uniref:hypothetical protein n=1 Tax=Acidithiobacillus sp. TaxID=1872118 RepID=UPI003D04EE98